MRNPNPTARDYAVDLLRLLIIGVPLCAVFLAIVALYWIARTCLAIAKTPEAALRAVGAIGGST